jgi:hypothetical protein
MENRTLSPKQQGKLEELRREKSPEIHAYTAFLMTHEHIFRFTDETPLDVVAKCNLCGFRLEDVTDVTQRGIEQLFLKGDELDLFTNLKDHSPELLRIVQHMGCGQHDWVVEDQIDIVFCSICELREDEVSLNYTNNF